MKVLIYGAGVIGSIFAAKLSLSGQNITVLDRGKRLEEIKRSGIIIFNPKTKNKEIAKVKVIEALSPEMEFDYILIVMQKNQVDSILECLSKNCTKNIVFIVNTAAGYEQWEKAVGRERLMIGFPAAGGERRGGTVHYFVFRKLTRIFQTTTFGEINGKRTQRVTDIIRMFNHAGISSVFCTNMDAWQKSHVAMVTSIANALYGHDCGNKELASSRTDLIELVLAIKEGFAVLKRLGIQPTPRKLAVFKFPASVLAVAFGLIMRTQFAEITMAKHCIVAKEEMVALQNEFDQLIVASKTKTPHIDGLKQNLMSV